MRLKNFLPLWSALWTLGLPVAILYLAGRARRDRRYLRHLGERFGRYRQRMSGPVWIHAVSLGEVRSAVPIASRLLSRGETVVFSHLTPAGRAEAEAVFATEIAAGRVASVWLPVETSWAYRGFFTAFQPRAGLVMEVEHWPRMIAAARARGVPLFPCNAQYPKASFDTDRTRRRWRAEAIGGYAGAFVKSELQAGRFRATGLRDVVVTGETRFDQPVPPALLSAGTDLRARLGAGRTVIAIASAVEGEDPVYTSFIRDLQAKAQERGRPRPLILYVPRRPERFDVVAAALDAAGITFARRSILLDARLALAGAPPDVEVILGDSTGEMYAWLAMADCVVVGGGFTPAGAHNIIEPLAVGRPVITGPVTWPIEYPFEEARAAGLALSVPDAPALAEAVLGFMPEPLAIAAFCAAHGGAADRTLAALDALTRR